MIEFTVKIFLEGILKRKLHCYFLLNKIENVIKIEIALKLFTWSWSIQMLLYNIEKKILADNVLSII